MSRLGRLEQEIVDEVMIEFYEILQQNKKFFASHFGKLSYVREKKPAAKQLM